MVGHFGREKGIEREKRSALLTIVLLAAFGFVLLVLLGAHFAGGKTAIAGEKGAVADRRAETRWRKTKHKTKRLALASLGVVVVIYNRELLL